MSLTLYERQKRFMIEYQENLAIEPLFDESQVAASHFVCVKLCSFWLMKSSIGTFI